MALFVRDTKLDVVFSDIAYLALTLLKQVFTKQLLNASECRKI